MATSEAIHADVVRLEYGTLFVVAEGLELGTHIERMPLCLAHDAVTKSSASSEGGDLAKRLLPVCRT